MAYPYKYTFTVFTPTYNRAHTLHRVYDSLKMQTFRDFEWLIVDDGSNDATRELVESWIQEASFPIRIIYQTNQGKHIAFNLGVREAQGELFLTIDSDDRCVPEALERFKYYWDSIPELERDNFSAVTSLCRDQYGNPVGTKFPFDVTDSNSLEIHYKYKVTGEKWGFHRTDVLKKYPFPETYRGVCYPESLIWRKIARNYQTRFVNEYLRIYYRGEGGSLMSEKNLRKVAIRGRLDHQEVLNEYTVVFSMAPREFLRSAVHYTRFSLHRQKDFFAQYNDLNNLLARIVWLVSFPLGTLVYMWDKIKSRN